VLTEHFPLSPLIAALVLFIAIFKIVEEVGRRSKRATSVRRLLSTPGEGDVLSDQSSETGEESRGRLHSDAGRQNQFGAQLVVTAPPTFAGFPFGILLYATCALANIASFFKTMPVI
jgi:hypothetical protein